MVQMPTLCSRENTMAMNYLFVGANQMICPRVSLRKATSVANIVNLWIAKLVRPNVDDRIPVSIPERESTVSEICKRLRFAR